MNQPQPKEAVVTIGGKAYQFSILPKEVQDLIAVYSKWERELADAKVEVFKLEAAMKGVSKEIELRMEPKTKAQPSEK